MRQVNHDTREAIAAARHTIVKARSGAGLDQDIVYAACELTKQARDFHEEASRCVNAPTHFEMFKRAVAARRRSDHFAWQRKSGAEPKGSFDDVTNGGRTINVENDGSCTQSACGMLTRRRGVIVPVPIPTPPIVLKELLQSYVSSVGRESKYVRIIQGVSLKFNPLFVASFRGVHSGTLKFGSALKMR